MVTKLNDMIGIYKMSEDRISEMKGRAHVRLIKALGVIFLIFIIAILFNKNLSMDKATAILMVAGLIGITFLLFVVISSFVQSPICNTIIEITDQGLVRSGQELLTVRFKFGEIEKMITKDNGTY